MQSRLRILVHHRIASRDGQGVHLEEMISALIRCGHEVKLVGPSRFGRTSFGGSNRFVDQIKKAMPKQLYQLLEILYNVVAFVRLMRAVKSFRPSVIYERFSLYLLAGVAVSKLHSIPLLLEINSPLFEERLSDGDMGFAWLGRECQRLIWRCANRLLPVTKVLAETIENYDISLAGRVCVIPNGTGIDVAKAQLGAASVRRELKLSGRLIIGFVGFVRNWNAVDRLLTFLQRNGRLHNLHLLVVGDGPARLALEQAARDKNVSDLVTITGLVPRDNVGSYIAIFDIAVIPGVTPYSSPLKMFEYMGLSLPIVAPSTKNIREILIDDQNALLFDPAICSTEFETCLLRLSRDPELRISLGAKAKETIQKRKLTWDHNAAQVLDIANALILDFHD